MLGILLVSHGKTAEGLLDSAKMFFGIDIENIETLSLNLDDSTEDFHVRIQEKINKLDQGDGVVILADLFGGTPCNQARSFASNTVRVISGVNLPMLVELLGQRLSNNINYTSLIESSRNGIIDINEIRIEEKEEDFFL